MNKIFGCIEPNSCQQKDFNEKLSTIWSLVPLGTAARSYDMRFIYSL